MCPNERFGLGCEKVPSYQLSEIKFSSIEGIQQKDQTLKRVSTVREDCEEFFSKIFSLGCICPNGILLWYLFIPVRQLFEYAEKCFDIEEEDEKPFMESCSEYEQSSELSSESSSDEFSGPSTRKKRKGNRIESSKNKKRTGESNEDSSSTESLSDENDNTQPTNVPLVVLDTQKPVGNNFVPRMKMPNENAEQNSN
ncbi:hypothetical protein HHI36_022347 [Cryptolaemus montrouzieri]|uniref:Uncharacterized protein n=1 Tax=Cryptolaemus montrouzieri TaxID=559131 RepID=A0ABD2MZY7_9CUCU